MYISQQASLSRRAKGICIVGSRRKGVLVFARRVEGCHSRQFIHTLGATRKQRFIEFGVNFLIGGTPGASRAPLADQVRSQVDLLMVFRCPGDALWGPGGSFARPGACLGATLGVTSAQNSEEREKELLLHTVCLSRLWVGKESCPEA